MDAWRHRHLINSEPRSESAAQMPRPPTPWFGGYTVERE